MLLIGSTAVEWKLPGTLKRSPADFDLIGLDNCAARDKALAFSSVSNKPVERAPNFLLSDAMLLEKYKNAPYEQVFNFPVKVQVLSLNDAYMLKMSHRFLKNSAHFFKTMRDIHYLRAVGAVIEPASQEIYEVRMKETLSYNHPNLNTSKKSFFNEYDVAYTYDHDSLHEAVKFGDKPAYKYYSKDGQEVLSDSNKFFALPDLIRLHGVTEEACVLALERSVIPHNVAPSLAFPKALEKVCTSITSGWFREYAWEHYAEAMFLGMSYNFKAKFVEGLNNGTVKYFSK